MTTDDRTPDTREVRDMYDAGSNLFRETPEQHYLGHPAPDYGAEFDRWLARVRRDAARQAEAERDEWRQTALDERAAALDALEQIKVRDARIKVRDARIKAALAVFGREVGDA